MRAALERHDAILGSLLAQSGGVVFKTVGDAFCAAFGDRSLRSAPQSPCNGRSLRRTFPKCAALRVRIALHTGYAQERGGDFFGGSVNRVARLLATGHGDQIIASGVTCELLIGALDREFELLDLGEHRLKDLLRPERVFQIGRARTSRGLSAPALARTSRE